MKKIFYIITFIVLSMNIFAQNPITPNGKEVNASSFGYLSQSDIDYINNQIITNYSFVETIQSPQPYFGTFNCHFFAWNNNQGYTIWSGSGSIWQNGTPSEYKWLNYPTDYFSDGSYSNPSGYTSYVQTTESSAPIAVYKSSGTITHSARRLSGSTELISKWGAWGVYQHEPAEVPTIYGAITEKYKINPNYRPVGSGDPGGRNWGTINNALSGIPSSSVVTVYSGTHYLSADAQISSGITLKINTSATVNLGSYSIVLTGGTVTNNGSLSGLNTYIKSGSTIKGYCGSVQSAVNNWISGYTVDIQSGSFTENVSFSSKNNITIKGQGLGSTSINGSFTISSSSNLTLDDFNCKSVSLSGCSGAKIYINILKGDGEGSALYSYNSSLEFSQTTSNNNCRLETAGYGLSSALTTADIKSNYYYPAKIFSCQTGVFSSYNSNIDIEYNSELCEHEVYDLRVSNNGYIYADNCLYSTCPPNTYNGGGTIDIINCYLCGSKGLAKGNSNANYDNKYSSSQADPALEDFTKVNAMYFELTDKLSEDYAKTGNYSKEIFYDDYSKVITGYKDFIKQHPESGLAKTALTTLVHCSKTFNEYEAMNTFLKEIGADKSFANISGLAKRFTIDYFSNKKDYTAALYTADQLLKETKLDEDFTCDILYAKGLIYSYDLNETVKAVDCFSGIVNNYPDNILVEGAKNELQLLGYKTVEQKKVTVEDRVSNFEIVNYPNPFNPTTTISYSLPEAGNVQIKIFDVLGREVAKLVDDTKSVGKHSVTWNGSNSASGIYFYTITFNNQTLYKKMLMVK